MSKTVNIAKKTSNALCIKAGTARITKRKDYLETAASRRKWVTPAFIIQIDHLNDDKGLAKLGFTASKKVGNAVMRNKARRRLKEAAKGLFNQYGLAGQRYVLIARTAAIDYPFDSLQKDLQWALVKLAQGADLKPKVSKHDAKA